MDIQVLPASHIVEHWVPSLGCSCLVEDVERLQCFELFLLMDLVPKEQRLFIHRKWIYMAHF